MSRIDFQITTDVVVEMDSIRSRKRYFMVTQLRYSTATWTTMIKFALFYGSISFRTRSRKSAFYLIRLLRYLTWTASPKRDKFLFSSSVFFFPNIGVRCSSHNWSKILNNILQTYRGVNRGLPDIHWVYSVKGFRSYGNSKLKNILKISPCYFRQDLISRDISWQKHASCTNGWTNFNEPYFIQRWIERPRKQTFLGGILLRVLWVFQGKNDFSMWNNGISA